MGLGRVAKMLRQPVHSKQDIWLGALGDPEKAPNELFIWSGGRCIGWYPAAQVFEVKVGWGTSQHRGGIIIEELAADLVDIVQLIHLEKSLRNVLSNFNGKEMVKILIRAYFELGFQGRDGRVYKGWLTHNGKIINVCGECTNELVVREFEVEGGTVDRIRKVKGHESLVQLNFPLPWGLLEPV
jgi:hypothetical protein